MNIIKTLQEYTPAYLLRLVSHLISDKLYIQFVFKRNMGMKLNLHNPETFQEKLQWLKLYNRKDIYTRMVDKYEVKEYVANIIGEEYIIPTLGVWNNADEIDFELLPNQFVLKTTHDSGRVIICKDKNLLDIHNVITFFNERLNNNIFYSTREWPYKNVPHRIIAEKFIVDESGQGLKDYKFFTFNGKVEFFKVDFDRFKDHRANYYDINWNILPFEEKKCPRDVKRSCKSPLNYDKMLEIVRKLSQDIPFIRVDLYNINGTIFFGELTFFPDSGLGEFNPSKWDKELGSLIKLSLID